MQYTYITLDQATSPTPKNGRREKSQDQSLTPTRSCKADGGVAVFRGWILGESDVSPWGKVGGTILKTHTHKTCRHVTFLNIKLQFILYGCKR